MTKEFREEFAKLSKDELFELLDEKFGYDTDGLGQIIFYTEWAFDEEDSHIVDFDYEKVRNEFGDE